jgi:hypothetical protein
LQPQCLRARLQVDAVRIAAGAAPVGRRRAKESGSVQIDRLAMIGIHVIDRALLGFQERLGAGKVGQEVAGLEIDDAAKPGDQMGPRRLDPEERKIPKLDKGFGRRMSGKVAPAQACDLAFGGLFGPPRQHDPGAFQRIAFDPLVQHQRNP